MRGGRSLLTRVTLFLCALRLAIEERIEPVIEESEEVLARFVPQIAALV